MRKGFFISCLLILTLVLAAFGGSVTAYASTSVSRYTAKTYTHSQVFDNTIVVDGIDVSYVQQNSIDWNQVKADGIDYAIIRVGARGYGSAGKLIVDDYYKENIERAQAAGVMVGVYFFSQALNTLEARAEANYTLELIEGYSFDLPVYMDYEFAGGSSGRLTNAQLSKIKATQNVEAFCQVITEAGRQCGIYANLNFLNKTIDGKALSQKYPVWVAQYNTWCDFENTYDSWQYSSSGGVSGVSGRVDVNFMYLPHESGVTSSMSLANCSAAINGTTSYTYKAGSSFMPSVSVSYAGIPLTEGVDYSKFYLKNTRAGTAYVMIKGKGSYTDYKLIPFTIKSSDDLSGITINSIADKTYTGSSLAPSTITVKDSAGDTLVNNLDYTFTVSDAVDAGTAKVKVNFMGNYSGSKTLSFKINKAPQTIKVPVKSFERTIEEGSFDLGNIVAGGGGALTFKSGDTKVAKVSSGGRVTPMGPGKTVITVTAAETPNYTSASATISVEFDQPAQIISTGANSYTKSQLSAVFSLKAKSDQETALSYASSDETVASVNSKGVVTVLNPGTAVITITAPGNTNYKETVKEIPVTVNPLDEDAYAARFEKLKSGVQGTKVVLLKAYPDTKKVKLTWKLSSSGYSVDYYQIWRSTKKSSGYKKIFTSGEATSKYYINTKELKSKSTYWYKVRGVRNLNGKLVYTPFTKIQTKTK